VLLLQTIYTAPPRCRIGCRRMASDRVGGPTGADVARGLPCAPATSDLDGDVLCGCTPFVSTLVEHADSRGRAGADSL